MAWSSSRLTSIDSLVARVQRNDPSLKSLFILPQKKLTGPSVASLVSALIGNSHLTELYASGHDLDPETLESFADLLGSPTNVERVSLGSSTLGDSGLVVLCRGLASNLRGNIKSIDLENKSLTEAGARSLAAAIDKNKVLSFQDLNLSRNSISVSGTQVLAALGERWSRLETLDITANGLDATALAHVADIVRCAPVLKSLRMGGNNFRDGQVALEDFACAVAKAPSLTVLALAKSGLNVFSDVAAKHFANSALTSLDISDNIIDAKDVDALGLLLTSSCLGDLNLAGNSTLGPDLGPSLAVALEQRATAHPGLPTPVVDNGSTTFKNINIDTAVPLRLDLSRTGIDVKGATAIIAASGLKVLILTENDFGDEGAVILADEIRSGKIGTCLTRLDLANNNFLENGCCAILDALACSDHSLHFLSIGGNELGDRGEQRAKALKSERGLEVVRPKGWGETHP